MAKTIVVTGGAGYIGSHVVHVLVEAGYTVLVIDDLSNSIPENLNSDAIFYQGDFANKALWQQLCATYKVDGVVHLAAFIDVVESFQKPAEYLLNNAVKTGELLQIVSDLAINNVVFASTCGVYNNSNEPLTEASTIKPSNPYAYSKLVAEQFISYAANYQNLNAAILRFFNIAGTVDSVNVHPKTSSALLSQIRLYTNGELEQLKVYGNTFPTKDGSCIRDFVHVYDIAQACELSIKKLLNNELQFEIFNIGSEHGYSVLELIAKAEKITGKSIHYQLQPPRVNEIITSVASSKKIKQQLGFQMNYSDIDGIIKSVIIK